MLLRVTDGGVVRDVEVRVGANARVGDLAACLGFGRRRGDGQAPGSLDLWVDGQLLAADRLLAEVSVLDGALVSDHPTAPAPAQQPAARGVGLDVVGGLDAGRTVQLGSSGIRLGRGSGNDVVVADPTVSRRHCAITPDSHGVVVEALPSANGVLVDGNPLTPARPYRAVVGQDVACGAAVLHVVERGPRPPPAALQRGAHDGESKLPFYRQPPAYPSSPRITLDTPAAPSRPGKGTFPVSSLFVPLVMAGAIVAITRRPEYAAFAALSPVMLLVNYGEARHRRRRSASGDSRRFGGELADFEHELVAACRMEQEARRARCPDLASLTRWAAEANPRLWERRSGHPAFAELAVGTGEVRWQPQLQGSDPPEEAEEALERLGWLRRVPITVSFAPGRVLGLAGPRPYVLAMARAVLLQAAVLHGPSDLALAAMVSAEGAGDWDWVKWFPHASIEGDEAVKGGVGTLLYAGPGAGDRLATDLDRVPPPGLALVVLDAEHLPDAGDSWVRRVYKAGRATAGIAVASTPAALPSICDPVVTIDADTGAARLRPREGRAVELDPLGAGAATSLATSLALARFRDPESDDEMPSRTSRSLVELLGADSAEGVRRRWHQAPDLPAPFATVPGGEAQVDPGGTGPRLVVTGPSASGRSDLLRAMAVSLAATVDPRRLHLVLVGRALAPCAALPHVVSSTSDSEPTALSTLVEHLEVGKRRPGRADAGGAHTVVMVDDLAGLRRSAPEPTARLVRLLGDLAGGGAGEDRPGFAVGCSELWADVHPVLAGEDVGHVSFAELDGAGSKADLGSWRPRPTAVPQPLRPATINLSTDLSQRPTTRPFRLEPDAASAPSEHGPERVAAQPDLARLVEAVRTAAREEGIEPPGSPFGHDGAPALAPPAVDLADLLGVDDLEHLDPRRMWSDWPNRSPLAVPLGLGVDGAPVVLDLKEPAYGGMGPHGVVVGATGSGKSELLRTLVVALALTHPPEALSFVLVDFKGGATFEGLARLPQVGGMVTNLEGDLTLVDRVRDAITGELLRRQRLLRDAGNLGHISRYAERRAAGDAIPPLPTLVVILDEFVELLSNAPDFVDVLLNVGRVGRSVGVYLLLASQQLEEGRLRGLDRNLRYRLALRTETATESRAVLGVPDAAALPSTPGSAYLRVGPAPLRQFRAAYVSAPHRPGDRQTIVDVAVSRVSQAGAEPARQVWLPPLPPALPLARLLPDLSVDPVRGLVAKKWPFVGRLRVPLGLIDRPIQQAQEPMVLDLSAAQGNVAVVGAPQSGKSTLLRTLMLSLAVTHAPSEVQCYAVDLGGGTLATMAELPHVGAVAARQQPELVRRLVAEVDRLLDRREELFARHRIDGPASMRALRSAGGLPGEPYGDVFLLIDGWGSFRQEFESLEPLVSELARRGLGYGIHVVVTASRWGELRSAFQDSFASRVELRLNNPADSQIDRRAAARVRPDMPGRGLSGTKELVQVALPRIDQGDGHDELTTATRDAVRQVSAAWPAAAAPPVRLLPEHVDLEAVLAAVPPEAAGLPVGLGESDLGPVVVDLDGGSAHFVVFGDAESGKTTFLATLAASIAARRSPDRAQLLVVDYRRTLLDSLPDSHVRTYAGAAPVTQQAVSALRAELESRLPSADVTAAQLRQRSWWSGPDIYVLVDDYDLVVGATGGPLGPLADLLPQGRDVGLHVVLARRVAGATRASFDPVLARVREVSGAGLLLCGDRQEGPLLGTYRASEQPAGRGLLVARRAAPQLVQVATVGEQP